ncbi:MAG: four helix bundle protein [Planctomycetota bacterium]|nr:four helix bundle protein [Planctomycetota bacterium]
MDFAQEVYIATRALPPEERYGLTSQMRRAVVSIPSNIAEGQGRGGAVELVRFLRIAYASLREVETLSERFEYLAGPQAARLLDRAGEVGRLLNGLMKSHG